MTTKLLNFKTFLSKATYQPVGIKPCTKPGQHRHWGRMDCHDIPQKHKKHLKQGIDLHHGMDSMGQIPEGTVPPNAHEFYDDGHHMAAAHGEHTGSKGGICKPGEYPKGSGKLTPFHRHPGADYCHSVSQKHGSSSPNKAIAQKWHDTHVADIQASWYEFNEKQGLPQEEIVADSVSDAVSPYDEDAEEAYDLEDIAEEEAAEELAYQMGEEDEEPAINQIESPGSVANPFNAAVNDIITLKEDYIVDHPAKTYQILEIYEEGDLLGANLVHTETGDENVIALSNDNIESVEHWEPTGDPVDSANPHEFAIGSVFTSASGAIFTITGIDIPGNKLNYTQTDDKGENPAELSYALDGFNEWVTDELQSGGMVNPPVVPDGFQHLAVGDTIGTHNIKNLNVGAVFQQIYADGTKGATGTITQIDDIKGWAGEPAQHYHVDWLLEDGTSHESGHSTAEVLDSNWQIVAYAPEGISQEDVEKFVSDDAVEDIPKVGTTLDSQEMFANIMPGTTLIASNGVILHIKDNKAAPNEYYGGILDYTLDGSSEVNQISWEQLSKNAETFSVKSLPDVASYVKNKGFQLGGKVHSDNFASLPVGLSFAYNKGTEGLATATVTQVTDTGIYVDLLEPSGSEWKNTFISELTQLGTKEDTEKGLKIVALPDGTAVQNAPEPKTIPPFNPHGLDKGTTVTVQDSAGISSIATIVKTHKTKTGQNYTLEFQDGPNKGTTKKISSLGNIQPTGSEIDGTGIIVDSPIYKPGQEPEETIELTLPPLGSEPGNWDEVLEKVSGAMGYQEGGVFKHKQTGEKFYVKFSSSGNDQQVKSEALASQLYALCGIRTLSPSLIDFEGKTALLSNWNENLEKIKISDMANEPGIMNSFVIDAWLANWDVVGPQHDNMQKSGNQIVKIDSGGALKFGGAGGAKAFTNDVKELESMRDPDLGKVAHEVFQNITEENLKAGAQVLKSVKDSHIDAIVDASQVPDKEKMKATLKARRDDILNKIATASEAAGHPGQHKHKGYPSWHSKNQAHSGHLKEANAAHKEIKEGPYQIGGTQEEGKNIWSAIASTRSPELQAFAKKAQAVNFLSSTNDTHSNHQNVRQFLKENGIEDIFDGPFAGWQGGGTGNAKQNATIRAALFHLKGIADSDHVEDSEKGFWNNIIGADPDKINDGWSNGIQNAKAIIPYIVLSQQYTKAMSTDKKTGRVKNVFRGYQDKSSYSLNNTGVATLMLDALATVKKANVKTKEVRVPNDGISGYSTNEGIAQKFSKDGSGQGVVVKKSGLNVEDVLINFNAFSGAHTGEREILIDSSAVRVFSPDEIYKTK